MEAYAKEQGLFLTPDAPDPVYSDTLSLDLAKVTPSMAGPKRPQDRIELADVKENFLTSLGTSPKSAKLAVNGHHEKFTMARLSLRPLPVAPTHQTLP